MGRRPETVSSSHAGFARSERSSAYRSSRTKLSRPACRYTTPSLAHSATSCLGVGIAPAHTGVLQAQSFELMSNTYTSLNRAPWPLPPNSTAVFSSSATIFAPSRASGRRPSGDSGIHRSSSRSYA